MYTAEGIRVFFKIHPNVTVQYLESNPSVQKA